MSSHVCCVCGSVLSPVGELYSIEQLFELWLPIKFSDEVIEEHKRQATKTQLHRCDNCQLEIFFPQIIGEPSFYQELLEPVDECVHRQAYYEDTKWDFLEAQKEVSRCGSIIEFGCGSGQFLALSASSKERAVGVEYNEAAIAAAKAKGLEVYSVGTLPVEFHELFEGAFSFHVLEHVSSPLEFLKDMVKCVKPGGLIGVSVPNQAGPIKYMDFCEMNMPPHHATRWRESTFRYAASQLGLQVERVAFEPLLLSNHSYYSTYWINYLLKKRGFILSVLLKGWAFFLKVFFRIILIFGFRYFPMLRGQSIYVVFRKMS